MISTSSMVNVELVPLGRTLRVGCGESLRDLLFQQGVEFPCGGRGRCRGCRVRVLAGFAPAEADETEVLTAREREDGWRLGCRIRGHEDLRLELAQWDASVLSDDATVAFVPREGSGVVVDLGTTTLVVQWVDLRTGRVLGVRTAWNGQARHGADIMSRVEFGLSAGGGATLTRLIREQVGGLISELAADVGLRAGRLIEVVIVGNTVMHHLFGGLSVEPLSRYPFEPERDGLQEFRASELGWGLSGDPLVHFLPGVGGFVGSDILAGILTTGIHEAVAPVALVDLGTNGEIVVGNRDRMLCTSTAAGPAFEGARIRMGMRASTGAISEVTLLADGRLACHVLGRVAARGVCGSGLVDAVAAGLKLGRIEPSGRLVGGGEFELAAPVVLGQSDIREVQLAEGAIAAGLRLLLEQWGTTVSELTCIHLAGAFGNYISRASARRIGLLDFPPEKVVASGNTALRGAKVALLGAGARRADGHEGLRSRIRHVSLSSDARFQEVFVEEMPFPAGTGGPTNLAGRDGVG